jgi:hypothetical protein
MVAVLPYERILEIRTRVSYVCALWRRLKDWQRFNALGSEHEMRWLYSKLL